MKCTDITFLKHTYTMKKSLLLLALLLLAGRGFTQILDSAAVARQVDSLIQVSRGLTGKRELDKALEVNAAAEQLVLEYLGKESAAYGSVCFNFGRVLYFKGDYPSAVKRLMEAKSVQEKTIGREHPGYASSLELLAVIYWRSGDYEGAEPLFQEAIAIREKALGKESADYARGVANLANLYLSVCKYEKTEPLQLESCAILKKTLGERNILYATSLNNLATTYLQMGDFEKAESLYIESRNTFEAASGTEHPDYALCLHNLANLYRTLGNYEKAEPLHIASVGILEKRVGKEHPDYAQAVFHIGYLYSNMGDYRKSEVLFIEAQAIWEKTFGKEHPEYAMCIHNLASSYQYMGDYAKAETLCLESKAIRAKVFGETSRHYAISLNNLGGVYLEVGQHEKAESLHAEAKRIQEKTVGKNHSEYTGSLQNLTNVHCAAGNFTVASTYLREAFSIEKSLLLKSTRHLSERELASYTAKFAEGLTLGYSLAHFQPDISGPCYDNALFHKGFLLGTSSRVSNLAGKDPATIEQFNLLKSYNRRLAAEYSKPIAERKGVAELEAKANDLEKELTRTVAGYGEAMQQVKWQDVQAALRPGEVAVEFVHCRFWNRKQTDSVMYAALVLRHGAGEPLFVPLFEEKQLETLLQRGSQPYEAYIKNLYAHREKSLYALLWQPLEKVLADAKTIYYSPSGLLHRLNLAALPTSAATTLADRHTLRAVGSTRLLASPSPAAAAGTEAVLFGGIQYDMDSTAVGRANATLPAQAPNSGLRRSLSFSQTDSTLRGGSWQYLPGTDKEVSEAEKLLQEKGLKTNTFRAYAATEEAFKSIGATAGRVQNPSSGENGPSPRILHLATHGFFFPDPKASPPNPLSGREGEPIFRLSDNPLIRSGLIMAGGNHAWKTGKPLKPGMDDGILTAYEISQMNLSGTELVVLSACETGLGDIQGNEGVYGLQRAFKIAGAKYVVMSLWQVPDRQTSRLMTLFYKNWLTEKMTVPEALQAAQNDLRKRGFDPFYWAGFVLVE